MPSLLLVLRQPSVKKILIRRWGYEWACVVMCFITGFKASLLCIPYRTLIIYLINMPLQLLAKREVQAQLALSTEQLRSTVAENNALLVWFFLLWNKPHSIVLSVHFTIASMPLIAESSGSMQISHSSRWTSAVGDDACALRACCAEGRNSVYGKGRISMIAE